MPGRALLAEGPDVGEGELEEIVLWPPEEEEAESSGDSEEEDGPGSPLWNVFFLCSSFCFSFSYKSFLEGDGQRERDTPLRLRKLVRGWKRAYLEMPAAVLGQWQAASMAHRASCSGL